MWTFLEAHWSLWRNDKWWGGKSGSLKTESWHELCAWGESWKIRVDRSWSMGFCLCNSPGEWTGNPEIQQMLSQVSFSTPQGAANNGHMDFKKRGKKKKKKVLKSWKDCSQVNQSCNCRLQTKIWSSYSPPRALFTLIISLLSGFFFFFFFLIFGWNYTFLIASVTTSVIHPVCMCAKSLQPCLTLCDPMDCSTPGSSVHRESPGKNTGMGCHVLLQGFFLAQGLNQSLMSPALTGRFFTTSATWDPG